MTTIGLFDLTSTDRQVLAGVRQYGPSFDSGYCSECGRRGEVRTWRTVEIGAPDWPYVFRSWHFQCRTCQASHE